MAKPYIPKFQITVTRSFDGETEGSRTWVLSGPGAEIDKLENCIAFVANAAMDHIPKVLREPVTERGKVYEQAAE